MLNDGRSDHFDRGPGADDEGFRPTRRQIVGGVVAIVLLVFIAVNSQTIEVSFVFFRANLPLWAVLGLTAVLAFGIGMLFGSRRTKRKLVRD
jgi:uncharacterized integral membrane protein